MLDGADPVDPATGVVSPARARAVAEIMQALASPTRVRILDQLRQSPCTVGQLAVAVGLAQNAVSNHLRLLRHLALVTSDRRGRHVVYALHDEHIALLIEQVLDHVAHLAPASDERPAPPPAGLRHAADGGRR